MRITGRIDNAPLDRINRQLVDVYGRGPNDLPYFRVVWADDMFERRFMTHSDSGVAYLQPQVRNVPKYKHFIQGKYVLESLTIVPEFVKTDLVDQLSYEPKWVFEDSKGNALYPRYDAMRMVLETMRVNMHGNYGQAKYKDPEADPVTGALERKANLDRLQNDLFGNESDITDALKLKSGIVVPG